MMHDKPMHQRILALDYDDTFSLAPEVWAAAMAPLLAIGFKVWGVTARNEFQPIHCVHYRIVCDKIVYCAGRAKHPILDNLVGGVAVWIDDKPQFIHNDYPVGLCGDVIPDGHTYDQLRIKVEDILSGVHFYL